MERKASMADPAYSFIGPELETLCPAAGTTLADFVLQRGFRTTFVRGPRTVKRIECEDDPFACAAIDQTRNRAMGGDG